MKIKFAYLLAVSLAALSLSAFVLAQHPAGKPIKRHVSSRSHRRHRRERMVTVTLTRNHGKEVGYLRVPESVAKMMEKSKDKRIVVK